MVSMCLRRNGMCAMLLALSLRRQQRRAPIHPTCKIKPFRYNLQAVNCFCAHRRCICTPPLPAFLPLAPVFAPWVDKRMSAGSSSSPAHIRMAGSDARRHKKKAGWRIFRQPAFSMCLFLIRSLELFQDEALFVYRLYGAIFGKVVCFCAYHLLADG